MSPGSVFVYKSCQDKKVNKFRTYLYIKNFGEKVSFKQEDSLGSI
jgi:hypothetical protein